MIKFSTLNGVYHFINPINIIHVLYTPGKSISLTDTRGVVYYCERDKDVSHETLEFIYKQLLNHE